jgi:hypothetical protein
MGRREVSVSKVINETNVPIQGMYTQSLPSAVMYALHYFSIHGCTLYEQCSREVEQTKQDLYQLIASKIYAVDYLNVTREMRSAVKELFFMEAYSFRGNDRLKRLVAEMIKE